ncbi:F-type H+-transporting ATPase subunit delta [Sphingobium sp. B1D3A]|uniref:ATP synthase subunit delta n=1 Tax=Sphingobium lignivorans TaxID=2735886 RepID=A0ABR6NNJ8_9SPHN|nr:F0F1 ATP synthase subunit delta [Sphingobium lignivorans]MBB5987774.1 F-type H+-transporting ATPase subunit delta [Sphingobium lignivorans]BAK68408.1 ATP synthase delta chain [Sphingobium sp. SYK-6]
MKTRYQARVENSGGIQASLAGRYALALFELARDEKALDSVDASLTTLKAAIADSADLRTLIQSPLIGRDAAGKAIAAVAAQLQLDMLTTRTLGVLAQNHRLGQLPAVIRAFRTLLSAHKGETRAEVTSAFPLTKTQQTALAKQLKARTGRDPALDLTVDPAIMGGLIVKMGSQMIDGSLRTRLNRLAQAMKG